MTQTASANYLSPDTLARIGSLELRARQIVEGLMTGMHRSPYQGFSVEFAQHRQYAPGDDLRFLDWKVFARTDKLYLKQYQKETNLDLVLLVDTSGSMAYASHESPPAPAGGSAPTRWRKYDHAATLAAALAYLALRQQDRVGLVMFDDTVHAATRMSNAHEHWRAIVEALGNHQFSDPASGVSASAGTSEPPDSTPNTRATNLAKLFEKILAKLTQRSLIVLISDLFDDPEHYEQGLARMSHRRHDLIVLQTLDPAELTFPFRSPGEFFGLEGESRLRLDPAALRKAYLASLQAHNTRVEEITRRFRYDHLLLDTSQPVGPPLSHFLARRAAAVGRKG